MNPLGTISIGALGVGAVVAITKGIGRYLSNAWANGMDAHLDDLAEKSRRADSEFRENAALFADLLEPLWRVNRGDIEDGTEVFNEWFSRLEKLDAPNLKWQINRELHIEGNGLPNWPTKWHSIKARYLLSVAVDGGVKADKNPILITDDDTSRNYQTAPGFDYTVGETVHVLSPAWHLDGRLLAKGVVGTLKENPDGGAEENTRYNVILVDVPKKQMGSVNYAWRGLRGHGRTQQTKYLREIAASYILEHRPNMVLFEGLEKECAKMKMVSLEEAGAVIEIVEAPLGTADSCEGFSHSVLDHNGNWVGWHS